MVLQHVTACQCEACNPPGVIVIKGGCYATGDRYTLSVSNADAAPLPPRPMNRHERRVAAAKARHA